MGGKSSQACAATRRIMSNCTMAATRPHIFTKCSAWAWENQVRSWPGSHLSRTHADGRRKFARPAACQILNRTYQSRRLLAGPDSRNFVDLFRRIMSLGPKMAKHGRERAPRRGQNQKDISAMSFFVSEASCNTSAGRKFAITSALHLNPCGWDFRPAQVGFYHAAFLGLRREICSLNTQNFSPNTKPNFPPNTKPRQPVRREKKARAVALGANFGVLHYYKPPPDQRASAHRSGGGLK